MKFIFALLILSPLSWALEQPTGTPAEDLSEKAANRQYPGGAEQGDLKVQESLPTALLKVNKSDVQKEVYEEMFAEESKTKESTTESE